MAVASQRDTRFRLTEAQANELAGRFGTPVYVIDEAGFRRNIRRYLAAFRAVAPKCELSYASKANSTLAVLAIAVQEGLILDVASEGEFRAALAAGAEAMRCCMHGNNKSEHEIAFAVESGIGQIVADNFLELDLLERAFRTRARKGAPELLLRLAPGVDPDTHHLISTGQADTKFGFNISDGSAERAVERCLELGLPLCGFHCHVGSQLLDPEAQQGGAKVIAGFASRMMSTRGLECRYINIGGGLGVRYLSSHQPLEVEEYCRQVVASAQTVLEGSGLDPTYVQEPGRALIAEYGVTLYRVGVIKRIALGAGRTKTYACVDGGLADNPRPAMYGARYSVVRAARAIDTKHDPEGESLFTVSGRHCETDLLFPDVHLPSDLAEGDLLQVLCTGAYNASMASNYNRYPRPASVLVREDGSFDLVARADSFDEMLAREILPKGLRK